MTESAELTNVPPTAAAPDPRGRGVASRFEPPADCVLALPSCCANCGLDSTASTRLEPPLGKPWRAILVPHCSRCLRRLEHFRTRRAVAAASSSLLGLVVGLGLPLLSTWVGVVGYSLAVFMGATAPWILDWVLRRRLTLETGQTSPEVAVWWDNRGLVGSNSAWVTELARLNQGQVIADARMPSFAWSSGLLPVTFLAVAPSVFHWMYPTVVVLNLSPAEFELAVDGLTRGKVGVTSLESAWAGIRIPLGAGNHVLEARLRSEPVDVEQTTYRAEVKLEVGEEYLFVPGAEGFCFWLERTTYGRTSSKSRIQALGVKDGLIALPSPVDTWFAPNPAPNSDRQSTGGEMVAVRHSRCAEKPVATE